MFNIIIIITNIHLCLLLLFYKGWRTDAEAPLLWPPDANKNQLTGKGPSAWKDRSQEEKRATEDEMVGWHHQLNGHEFEQTPGDGKGKKNLECCSPWGHKESDTERLNNNNKKAEWETTLPMLINNKAHCQCQVLSRVRLCDPHGLYVAHQAPRSMEFFRHEYWSYGSHCLLQGIFPPSDQTQVSHMAGRFFTI